MQDGARQTPMIIPRLSFRLSLSECGGLSFSIRSDVQGLGRKGDLLVFFSLAARWEGAAFDEEKKGIKREKERKTGKDCLCMREGGKGGGEEGYDTQVVSYLRITYLK